MLFIFQVHDTRFFWASLDATSESDDRVGKIADSFIQAKWIAEIFNQEAADGTPPRVPEAFCFYDPGNKDHEAFEEEGVPETLSFGRQLHTHLGARDGVAFVVDPRGQAV